MALTLGGNAIHNPDGRTGIVTRRMVVDQLNGPQDVRVALTYQDQRGVTSEAWFPEADVSPVAPA